MRQIVLDTETTGLELADGHRIIEIGCIELVHRRATGRHWHRYLKPGREVDPGALAVHGITNEFLAAQPAFAEVAAEFLAFVDGAELVIHNAEFDVGFLDAELAASGIAGAIVDRCRVLDTLALARRMHPGQRNNLDALCKRLNVDASHRRYHGALLDAHLLVEVYLAMTAGQGAFEFGGERAGAMVAGRADVAELLPRLLVRLADAAERAAHEARMDAMARANRREPVWRQLAVPAGLAEAQTVA